MNWTKRFLLNKIAVSLLVRLWVEIILKSNWTGWTKVSLLVRLWVEMHSMKTAQRTCWSASLWGCELKWFWKSVETRKWKSASLWGCELKFFVFFHDFFSGRSASLWGCELKSLSCLTICHYLFVSLLVRLWVEIYVEIQPYKIDKSASLWGCELKCKRQKSKCAIPQSASLWGCELKCKIQRNRSLEHASASLWGCELKYKNMKGEYMDELRQPPCEAVSWNNRICKIQECNLGQPPCEAVSWNIMSFASVPFGVVSLLVRLWVEMNRFKGYGLNRSGQPPCEAVSWNYLK